MGFLDKLFGRPEQPQQGHVQHQPSSGGYEQPRASSPGGYGQPGAAQPDPRQTGAQGQQQMSDEQAIARYRYMLRTAPPETIEQVHADAFARLTPEQRQQVLDQLSTDLPESERPRGDDPREMARAATRAEMRQPGYMESSFGRRGGMGMGGMAGSFGGSLMGTIAGVMVGSMLYDAMFDGYGDSPEAAEVGDQGVADAGGGEGELPDGGEGGDAGGFDSAGYDGGGFDGGGLGGGGFDSGGFGGGDVGGGDFGGF